MLASNKVRISVQSQRSRHRRSGRATAEVVQRHLGIGQVGVSDGVQMLGAGDAAQHMLAEVDQRRTLGQTIRRQRHGCGGDEDGRAFGDGANPSGAVDGPTVVIAVTHFDLARVDADPYPQRLGREPALSRHRALKAHCGDDRGPGVVEHVEGGIALPLVLDQLAPCGRRCGAHDVVMTGNGRSHHLGVALPLGGGAFNVGQQIVLTWMLVVACTGAPSSGDTAPVMNSLSGWWVEATESATIRPLAERCVVRARMSPPTIGAVGRVSCVSGGGAW